MASIVKLKNLTNANLETLTKVYKALLNGANAKGDEGMKFFARTMLQKLIGESFYRSAKCRGVKLKDFPTDRDYEILDPRGRIKNTEEAMSIRMENLSQYRPKEKSLITETEWKELHLNSELFVLSETTDPRIRHSIMTRLTSKYPEIIKLMEKEKQ